MNKRLSLGVAGMVLVLLSGAAQAQCENLRVIVRNSVYAIHGLDAFCTEFNQMKADLAGMRSELSIARQENAMLKARLEAAPAGSIGQASRGLPPLARVSTDEVLPR